MIQPLRVLLIGDVCYDVTHWCDFSKSNQEAKAPLAQIRYTSTSHGMASNVDACLTNLGIDVRTVFPNEKEWSTKTRFVDEIDQKQIFRLDQDKFSRSADLFGVNFSRLDAVVISDYNKGFVTTETILEIMNKFHGPIFLDTKKKHLGLFEGCYIKINEKEAAEATSLPTKRLCVTLGAKGARYENAEISTPYVKCVDSCGAGDAFLAGYVYCSLIEDNRIEALQYGNANAGLSIQHVGTYAPTLKALENEINRIRR